jgi:ATPase subunit of ABC transporter with duplicated ATPase domains
VSTLVEVDELVAGYGGPVLGPLSLRLAAGEVLGLWGPNGTGKSTLLKALLGQARVFSGRIRRAAGLGLSYQRQRPVRPSELPLTAREYVRYLGADEHALPSRLRPLATTRIDRLSGGQFQLLAVWAVLAGPARLVLLDEPTNNLDPDGIASLAVLLSPRAERGVIVVSHERGFLDACCTRVLEL